MNIGIDFGTSNTVISYYKNNQIYILENKNRNQIPTKIFIYNNKILCGNEIPNDISNGILINNFKNDIDKDIYYNINNKKVSILKLTKIYFNYIINIIKNYFEKNKYNCVISVPNNFNDIKKNIIKNILEESNINVIRIINEATSAAIAYKLDQNISKNEKILIIDIGAGTTDITILEKDDELFEIIESFGDNNIGGNNITNIIFNDVNKNNDDKILWYLLDDLKKNMMDKEYIDINYKDFTYTLSKNKLKKICKNIFINLKILFDKIDTDELNEIILVGGSCHLKILQEFIESYFNKKPIINDNLQTLVSKGCCYFSSYITSKNELIIIDNVKLSIGIETSDDNYSIIVPKGIPIPAKVSKKYQIKDLDNLQIKIYQGERLIANKNDLISIVKLDRKNTDIDDIIELIFYINKNNMIELNISNLNKKTHKNLKIEKQSINNNIYVDKLKNKINDKNIFMKNKIKYEIKNIIKKYIKILENNNKILYKKKIKNNLENIINSLENLSYDEMVKIKKKLYKKINF